MHAFLYVCFPLTGAAHNELSCVCEAAHVWDMKACEENIGLVFNLPSVCFSSFSWSRKLIVFQVEFDTYWFKCTMANAHTPCIGSCPNPFLWRSFIFLAVIVFKIFSFFPPQPYRGGRFTLCSLGFFPSVCWFVLLLWRGFKVRFSRVSLHVG